MDALCIKGCSKMRPYQERAAHVVERQPDLMINVRVRCTKERCTKERCTKERCTKEL
jgi:hypothetical protein